MRRAIHSGTFPGIDQGRCQTVPHINFFPGSGESPEPARNVCRVCPVRQQCLDAALAIPVHDDHGVLGATTPKERRKMRKGTR